MGFKTPMAEQTTTTAEQIGLKTPTAEQTTTTAVQMGLKASFPSSPLVPPSSIPPAFPLVPPSSMSPASPVIPPSLPLPPPFPKTASPSSPSPLAPFSHSTPPLTPICCVDLSRVFRSPAPPWKEDPLALPPATKSVSPPRLISQLSPPEVPICQQKFPPEFGDLLGPHIRELIHQKTMDPKDMVYHYQCRLLSRGVLDRLGKAIHHSQDNRIATRRKYETKDKRG